MFLLDVVIRKARSLFLKKRNEMTGGGQEIWPEQGPEPKERWRLCSGERQVADTLECIRCDHKKRYEYATEFIKNNEKNQRPIRVLDIFCGTGYGSYILAQNIDAIEIDGVDGSKEAVDFAKANFASGKIRYQHFIFPSAFGDQSKYDYIIAFESIEHVENDRFFLQFLLDHLRDDGVLFLSFPNRDQVDLMKLPNPYHFRHYNLKDIEDLLGKVEYKTKIIVSHGQDVNVYNEDRSAVLGLLDKENMMLRENHEGQFIIITLQKCG